MKKKRNSPPLTHARVIRMSPRKRMNLSIKDMPKYQGKNPCMVGDMRDHYPDGTYKSRFERGGNL